MMMMMMIPHGTISTSFTVSPLSYINNISCDDNDDGGDDDDDDGNDDDDDGATFIVIDHLPITMTVSF